MRIKKDIEGGGLILNLQNQQILKSKVTTDILYPNNNYIEDDPLLENQNSRIYQNQKIPKKDGRSSSNNSRHSKKQGVIMIKQKNVKLASENS